MTRTLLFIGLITSSCISQLAIANDNSAPIDTLNSLTEACHNNVTEEQVNESEKQQYLIDCVNAQLIEMGYQRQSIR